MIVHWVKKKTQKTSGRSGGENIRQQLYRNQGESKTEQDPEIQVEPEAFCPLSRSLNWVLGRACDLACGWDSWS